MTAYHRMSRAAKASHNAERMRELGVRCPWCEVECAVVDLLAHVEKRCSSPREPHPAARWFTWPEARALGVSKGTLSRLASAGVVRMRGALRKREYLARDLVIALVWRKRLSRAVEAPHPRVAWVPLGPLRGAGEELRVPRLPQDDKNVSPGAP